MNTHRHSPPERRAHRIFTCVAPITQLARKEDYEQVWAVPGELKPSIPEADHHHD
jgi:hypothetical protein